MPRLNLNPRWPFWVSAPPPQPTVAVGGGGVTTPLTITVSVTTSVTSIHDITKFITAAVTSTVTIPRSIAKTITSAVTATVTAPRQIARSRTITVTATASLVRSVGKIFALSVTSTVTVPRSVGKIITRAATATPTVPRQVSTTKSLSVTATSVLVRSVGKILSVFGLVSLNGGFPVIMGGSGADPVLVKQVGAVRAQSVTTTMSLPRQIGKIISRAVTTSLVFTGIKTGGTTFNMTISVVARVSSTSGFPFIMGTIGADPVLLTQFIAAIVPFIPTPTYPSLFRDKRGKGQERRDLWFRQKGDR